MLEEVIKNVKVNRYITPFDVITSYSIHYTKLYDDHHGASDPQAGEFRIDEVRRDRSALEL